MNKSNELVLEWALAKALLNIGVEESDEYVELSYPAKKGLQGYNSFIRISNIEFEKSVLDKDDFISVEKHQVRKMVENMYDSLGEMYFTIGDTKVLNSSFRVVLLSHAFAYSFWGGDPISIEPNSPPAWKVHLQNMVLEPDPVDYLRRFVPNPDQTKLELDENKD